MPSWAQVVLGVAAVLGALSVIWRTFIRPGARIISDLEDVMPTLRYMGREFGPGRPTLGSRLDSIQATADDCASRLERLEGKS